MEAYRWILFGFGCFVLAEADSMINLCGQNNWCEDCISAQKECAWCRDESFSYSRCSTVSDLRDKKSCIDVFNPDNRLTLTTNYPLQDGTSTSNPVQLKPQHMKVNLRPGKPLTLDMTYRIAENLPLDLYFVLDFSTTMATRLTSLADLTQNLIHGLKAKFTTNINIGFGSFLDKRAQPFHITSATYMKNPCVLSETTCAPSYGYIHRRKLNSDIPGFIGTVKTSKTSANFDPMEGGLDAILQAAVCPDIIGWRNQSRRVLIYISDSGFHFAGDGKLAGIDKPNDGECHLAPHGNKGEYIYTEELIQDYPSLGQIAEVLEKNKINTFFVVDPVPVRQTNDEFYNGGDLYMYKDFQNMISQAETATMNDAGAQSIIESITEFYSKLSQTVRISAEGIPDEVEVLLESDCRGKLNTLHTKNLKEEDFYCEDLVIGDIINYNVILEATACPENRSAVHSFKIHPVGLQESLTIDVNYICECDCPQSDEKDMEKCSQANGTYECGVCRCKEGRSGEKCQCSVDGGADQVVDESTCKRDNTSDIKCSNKGTCICGQCSCHALYSGKYCECDSSNCYKLGSQEKCGGKDRGVCNCDKCECKEGFSGAHCECVSESYCSGPNGEVCSGNGECSCNGTCECKPNYLGEKCETCPRCEQCEACGYEKCVLCLDETKHTYGDNSTNICEEHCRDVEVKSVKKFVDPNPCAAYDKEGCQITYLVKCDNITISLLIADRKQCTNPADPLYIALPLLAGIIGVGLFLLIIWKILTSFYDKIEYARFEHECKNPKWTRESNPIYDPPVTTNMNPTYKGEID